VKNYFVFDHSSKSIHSQMVYDGFCCYFIFTCQVDCQIDLVVYFTMLWPYCQLLIMNFMFVSWSHCCVQNRLKFIETKNSKNEFWTIENKIL
jgi:hypothetical protein